MRSSAAHLMVAVTPVAFGEVALGVRLARELVAAGDEVSFLVPRELSAAVAGAPVRVGYVDRAMTQLDAAIVEVARERAVDTIILVDAASVAQTFAATGLSIDRVRAGPAPVVALDAWNLDETGLAWDYGPVTTRVPRAAQELPRLIPVPLARPGTPAGYNALGGDRPVTAGQRAAARRDLGLGDDDRLVLWLAAAWQFPSEQLDATRRAMAAALPDLIVDHLRALGPRVRVLQVGPRAFVAGAALGPRFRWTPPVAPTELARILAATDVLLSLNAAASSIGRAIAANIPVLVGVNSRSETVAGLGDVDPAVRRWAGGVSLYPFRAWPLGLYSVLTPVLADNPLVDAARIVEVLDRPAFVDAARRLVFDDAARARAVDAQRRYVEVVDALPSAREALEIVVERATSS